MPVTNRGAIARHGSVRVTAGRREVACLLSGARATWTPLEHAAELERCAENVDELTRNPGCPPRERAFLAGASARARELAVRLRRGIVPRPRPRPVG